MSALSTHPLRLGTWTVLAEGSDRVRAVVSQAGDGYEVRDTSGRVLGRYGTATQALSSLDAPS